MELRETIEYCKGLIGHFEDEGNIKSASAIAVIVAFLTSIIETPQGWPKKIKLTHIEVCPCGYCVKGLEYNYAIDRCFYARAREIAALPSIKEISQIIWKLDEAMPLEFRMKIATAIVKRMKRDSQ